MPALIALALYLPALAVSVHRVRRSWAHVGPEMRATGAIGPQLAAMAVIVSALLVPLVAPVHFPAPARVRR